MVVATVVLPSLPLLGPCSLHVLLLLQKVTRSMAIPIPQRPIQCVARDTQEEHVHTPEDVATTTDAQLADQTSQAHNPTPHPIFFQGENEDMETDSDAIDVTKILDKEDPCFCLEYAKDIYEHLRTLEVNT